MGTSTTPCQIFFDEFNSLNIVNPLHLFEVRYAIKSTICRLCVLHAGNEDLKSLGMIIGQMESNVTRVDKFIELNSNFHCALVKATRNDFLISVSQSRHFFSNQDPWCQKRKLLLTRNEMTKHQKAHKGIFAAVQSPDADLASNEMKRHVIQAREAFCDIL